MYVLLFFFYNFSGCLLSDLSGFMHLVFSDLGREEWHKYFYKNKMEHE